MSDIIDSIQIISYEKSWPLIKIQKLKELHEARGDEFAAENFVTGIMEALELDCDDDYHNCLHCATQNDNDAKFCKECGVSLLKNEETTIINSINWAGEDSVESFQEIFVQEIVPLISGTLYAVMMYGDVEDESTPWKSAFFQIHDGKISFFEPDFERDVDMPEFVTSVFAGE